MITTIKGIISHIKDGFLVIDVHGIGFGVQVANGALFNVGQEAQLITYMHWNQEQGPSLFGFCNDLEHTIFSLLISCSGVGPKLALAVIADLGPERFIGAINTGDERVLSKVSGIGSKKAEQVIVQLKHKVAKLVKSGVDLGNKEAIIPWHEVEQVLESLNYSRTEIADGMKHVRDSYTPDIQYSFDKLVRQALSFLSKRP
jgi:holliday junction DNA helicase RuvA